MWAGVEIDVRLLWALDEGEGRHWDRLSLGFWVTIVVARIGRGGKDMVTVLECIWDPSPVNCCIIGWDMASIFSNWALEIFITTGCGITLLDTNKLVDEVMTGLACNTLPTVSVVYLVAGGAVVYLVAAGVDASWTTGGAVFLATGGGGGVFFVTGGWAAILLVTGSGDGIILVTGGAGGVILVTGGWGGINLVTGSGGIVNLIRDVVEVMDVVIVVIEFVHCILAELTVAAAAVGLGGLVVNVSFFTATSFGCFTTFLVVTAVDAGKQVVHYECQLTKSILY